MESVGATIANESGWIAVGKKDITFSSLIGVPVAGIPSTGFTNFTLEHTYFIFQCPLGPENWSIYALQPNVSDSSTWGGYIHHNLRDAFENNATFFIETFTPLNRTSTPGMKPRDFTFGSKNSEGRISIAHCSVTQSYVEAWVECEGKNCSVRPLPFLIGAIPILNSRFWLSRSRIYGHQE